MISRRARRVALGVAVALAGACKKNEGTSPPADTAAPAGAASVDALGDREQALAANAEQLRALGVELGGADRRTGEPERELEAEEESKPDRDHATSPKPMGEPPSATTETKTATRCTELCALASTACDLRAQICELAEDHVGEPRYEDACWRATDQCDRASTACDDCRGTTAGSAQGC